MGAGEGSGAGMTGKRILELVLCFLLPPLAVRTHSGPASVGLALLRSRIHHRRRWQPTMRQTVPTVTSQQSATVLMRAAYVAEHVLPPTLLKSDRCDGMQVFIHGAYSFGFHFILSVVLTIFAWVPGVIHAICAFPLILAVARLPSCRLNRQLAHVALVVHDHDPHWSRTLPLNVPANVTP